MGRMKDLAINEADARAADDAEAVDYLRQRVAELERERDALTAVHIRHVPAEVIAGTEIGEHWDVMIVRPKGPENIRHMYSFLTDTHAGAILLVRRAAGLESPP